MTAAREIMWRRTMDDMSFEHARIEPGPAGAVLSGTVLVAEGGTPLRVDYVVTCDRRWQTQVATVTQTFDGRHRILRLDHDGDGGWSIDGDRALALDGCTDVDLGISPITNALPVNRLGLAPGEERELRAAWVRFPGLEVVAAQQSYRRLDDRRYRYRSLASGFEAVIEVDDGLPVDYAGIWTRVAHGSAKSLPGTRHPAP